MAALPMNYALPFVSFAMKSSQFVRLHHYRDYAAPAAGRPRLPAEEAMAEGDGGVFEEDVSKADRTRQPIDARTLIAACDASTSIATASVDEVHLSARGRFAPGGYYRSVAVLRL